MLAHLPPRSPRPAKPVTLSKDSPLPETKPVVLHFDGSCAPNPGPMGIGYVINSMGSEARGERPRVLVRVGAQIGQGTNNEAEYQALIAGLRHALRLGMLDLVVVADSLLVVNQVTGKWKAKDKRLARLLWEAGQLLGLFQSWTIRHAYREDNADADALSRDLVFHEPELPPLPPANRGVTPPSLYAWQAGLVRVWWLSGRTRSVSLLARIFGVGLSVIEQIAEGKTYRAATFEGMPDWSSAAQLPPPELQSCRDGMCIATRCIDCRDAAPVQDGRCADCAASHTPHP